MNNRIVLLLTILLFTFSCKVEQKREITNVENGAQIDFGTHKLKVQFYNNDIVRVVKWLPQSSDNKQSLMVLPCKISKVDIKIQDQSGNIEVSAGKIVVKINKTTGNITFEKDNQNTVLQEVTQNFSSIVFANDSGYSVSQNFKIGNNEALYGLGQHQNGFMNLRGKNVTLVQSNTDAVIPMIISTNNYGILWDNYSKTIFKDTNEEMSLYSDMADNIDYYYINGENADSVISGYRYLTGNAPMYGKWAYGYWQSKEHYDTQAELMSVAKKYRELKMPIDNIIQDWDYWNGQENWGGMFFDKTLFPEPDQMVKDLHSMNYHIMISIWPAIGPNTAFYADMLKNGFLFPPVGWAGFKYYDAFNPAANQLYWKYLREGLYLKGIDGWWMDSTEPDIVNALTKEATEYEMKKTGVNYLGSWGRYLNAFSLSMTGAVYQNMRNESSDKRVYILTRSSYAGQQRNAATTWSGDIGASWEIYKNQITAGLNHSMAGVPYWTFDIGAFVIGSYGGVFPNGGKSPAYQELYTRMFQFGAFCPIFRSHGSETPREIWEFGKFSETLLKYDNLRYRLLPYIYSLAWQVTNSNYTIMRGLAMDFASDNQTYNIDDQFMFGPSVMACPVTNYMHNKPPAKSVLITSANLKTKDGKPGVDATFYKDPEFKNQSLQRVDNEININWYGGRPDYVTDSVYSIRWSGKLVATQTGKHQFHIKSFDKKRIFIDGKELPFIYTSVEWYTDSITLEAGKEYDFTMEIENRQTGAARAELYWRTPDLLEKQDVTEKIEESRNVYLPVNTKWFDFWTGKAYDGGQTIKTPAPIDIMPLFVKAGSIIPMGPFLQYSTEKPADPIELRIYPGANGNFTLYEDENDNYNYEKGVYSTITFEWDNANNQLIINDRKGEFPGMLKDRTFNIVLVKEGTGNGLEISATISKSIQYNGTKQTIKL